MEGSKEKNLCEKTHFWRFLQNLSMRHHTKSCYKFGLLLKKAKKGQKRRFRVVSIVQMLKFGIYLAPPFHYLHLIQISKMLTSA